MRHSKSRAIEDGDGDGVGVGGDGDGSQAYESTSLLTPLGHWEGSWIFSLCLSLNKY